MASDLVARIIIAATDKASGPLERAKIAAGGLAGALSKTMQELRKLEATKKTAGQFRDLKRDITETDNALRNNANQLRQLGNRMKEADKPTAAMRREYTQLTRETDKLTKQKSKLNTKLDALDDKLKTANFDTKNFDASYKSLSRSIKTSTADIDRQKNALERLAKAQASVNKARDISGKASSVAIKTGAAGAVAGAAVAAPVRAYASAEEASTDLRVAMMTQGGKVAAEYKQINDLATQLGDRLPGTTADFTNLMTMLIRQGISAKSILGGTGEAAALLSVQLKMAPEAAAEMAAKLQDATRGTEKEMVGIMDTVQRMFYAGVDSNNIVPAFSKLAPALDILKVKGKQATDMMGPLLGMLDQAGLSGESAGNALRKVFTRMMDADKVKKATDGTGISLDFTNGKGEFGGMPKMYAELAKLRNVTTQQRLQILGDIFGDDAETLSALNTMIEKGQAGYNEFVQKMAAQASLNERVNAQLGTLKNLWDAATGTATNFLVAMGEAIAPQVKSLTEWLGGVAEKMSAWAKANPSAAAAIMKTTAVVAGLLLGVSGLAAALSAVIVPLAMAKVAFSALNIGGFLAKIVSAGRIFGLLKTIIMGVGPMLMRVGSLFMQFAGVIGRGFMLIGRLAMANPIGIAIAVVVGALYLLWRNWDVVKSALIAGWQWIQRTFANNPILNFIFPVIGLARLLINNWGVIGPFFAGLWARLSGAVRNGLSAMGASIRALPVVQYFMGAWNAASGYLSGLGARLMNIGRNIVQGLINGIKEKLKPLQSLWQGVANLFNGTMTKTNEIHSPSRLMARLGGYIMQGLAVGVQRGKAGLDDIYTKAVGVFQNPLVAGGLIDKSIDAFSPFAGMPTRAPQLAGAVPYAQAGVAVGGGGNNYYITVQVAAGSNGQQIGNDIAAALRQHEAEKARRARGSFQDKD